MPKNNRLKRETLRVPRSLEEAAVFLSVIGNLIRQVESEKTDLEQKIENLKNQSSVKIDALIKEAREFFEGLYVYAEGHRLEITQDSKIKTISVLSGNFGWRMTPPAVSIRSIGKVLEELRRRDLKQFIRKKEEINKEAMLESPDLACSIKGVKISQHEEFFAKPSNAGEVTAPLERLKKNLG